MQEPMASLVEMQRLDVEMARLRSMIEANASSVGREQRALAEARRSLDETQEKIKQLQVVVDRHNVELGTLEDAIRKLDGQKMTLKTNEEYATMQRQIDAKRGETDALESRILEAMEVVENARNGLPSRKEELTRREAELKAAQGRVDAERAATEAEIAELQKQWDALAAKVDPGLVREYTVTRDRRNGRGLAALSPDNKCQECYISVQPNLMIEVMRGDMITCPSCNRLFYVLA